MNNSKPLQIWSAHFNWARNIATRTKAPGEQKAELFQELRTHVHKNLHFPWYRTLKYTCTAFDKYTCRPAESICVAEVRGRRGASRLYNCTVRAAAAIVVVAVLWGILLDDYSAVSDFRCSSMLCVERIRFVYDFQFAGKCIGHLTVKEIISDEALVICLQV